MLTIMEVMWIKGLIAIMYWNNLLSPKVGWAGVFIVSSRLQAMLVPQLYHCK
jgi:hypothetical protein